MLIKTKLQATFRGFGVAGTSGVSPVTRALISKYESNKAIASLCWGSVSLIENAS